jgi:hypothetical protein
MTTKLQDGPPRMLVSLASALDARATFRLHSNRTLSFSSQGLTPELLTMPPLYGGTLRKRLPKKPSQFSPRFQVRVFGSKLQRAARRKADKRIIDVLPRLAGYAVMAEYYRTGGRKGITPKTVTLKGPHSKAELTLHKSPYGDDPYTLKLKVFGPEAKVSEISLDVRQPLINDPWHNQIDIRQGQGPLFHGLSRRATLRQIYEILQAAREQDSPFAQQRIKAHSPLAKLFKALGRRLPF